MMAEPDPPEDPFFPIFEVDRAWAVTAEDLGTKRKYWFPYQDGKQALFKAEERGTGEDWAEVLAATMALLMRLPHVHYHLATETDGAIPGVICLNCAPPPWSLVHGNQLLLNKFAAYPTDAPKYKVRDHTIDAVCTVLQDLPLPPPPWCDGLPEGITSALGVFIGYIMFDAWIANQDRHHENWGALVKDGMAYLAPTFDHGAALARNLSDTERQHRLETKDKRQQLPAFARKARSAFYADASASKPLKTIAAWHAFAAKSGPEAQVWKERLRRINAAKMDMYISSMPESRMSLICKRFTLELLLENQRRILDGDTT
jgi:hypothetical protein